MSTSPFTYKRSEFWGDGHWVVAYPEGHGRVSKADDGTWSAFDWVTKVSGIEQRPALADGLSTRKDAAIVLRTVQQVANEMQRETDEIIRSMENRKCGHL